MAIECRYIWGRKLELSSGHIFKILVCMYQRFFSVKGKFSLVAVFTMALKRNAEQLKEIIVYSRKRIII